MIRTFIILGAAFICLSHCGDGVNAGAPEQKTVVVKIDTSSVKPEGGTPTSMNSSQISKGKQLLDSVSESELAEIDAKKIFKANCASCHGFTGDLGVNGAKDLTASVIETEEAIAQIYFGQGLMTPYKGVLSDKEIVAVAKYAETLRKK